MELKNYNVYFFFALLAGITFLIYFVIQPFLVPFLVAAILAHLFYPLYQNFLKATAGKKGMSSGLACLIIVLLILTPLVFLSTLTVEEVKNILSNISGESRDFGKIIETINEKTAAIPLIKFLSPDKFLSQESILAAIRSFSQGTLNILQETYRGIIHFIFVTFIMFFSLFYLFIDGKRLINAIIRLSPLKDEYEQILLKKFSSIVRATLKGTTLIAILQGTLGGILFWTTGVASPVLLGMLMTISSVIPSVGSGLVWFPVGIIMMILGYPAKGLIILLAGAFLISTIDNFIRPKLVGRDTQLHPLMILFSTLGGLALFGISGFIVGPIIMSLFVALWDIYSLEFKEQLEKFNI
jgi:predicted PurR-regulated permease PerM